MSISVVKAECNGFQILFYWELGFELKEIKNILGRADFEKAAALESRRSVLEERLARTQILIATIDKTIQHIRGRKENEH